ncbi:hypothetical protein EVAR_87332_1 [Eumeta japonica]|uniref:Uncharacterized protein n=1 Tax=Eumeta variegata TaxID=151549 RepID=A0A4C1YXV1_EUMVA|nr:hypothetical protein EVAR_87332_1 [Eumeta japonica]
MRAARRPPPAPRLANYSNVANESHYSPLYRTNMPTRHFLAATHLRRTFKVWQCTRPSDGPAAARDLRIKSAVPCHREAVTSSGPAVAVAASFMKQFDSNFSLR